VSRPFPRIGSTRFVHDWKLADTSRKPPVCSQCGQPMRCQDTREVSWLGALRMLARVTAARLAAMSAGLCWICSGRARPHQGLGEAAAHHTDALAGIMPTAAVWLQLGNAGTCHAAPPSERRTPATVAPWGPASRSLVTCLGDTDAIFARL